MTKIAHFVRDKVTKNTVRFSEDVEPQEEPVIGPLYVQKTAIASFEAHSGRTVDRLVVTLEQE